MAATSDALSLRVGFIGLGNMGFPMASHVAKNFECLVWNRNHERAIQHATEFGSYACSTLVQICDAQIIITCLPTSKIVKQLASEMIGYLKPGTIWIDCTCGDPRQSQTTAEFLSGGVEGLHFLDAPVSGGPCGAANASLAVVCSGNRSAFERVRPILASFSSEDSLRYVSDQIGAAQAVQAVNNTLNVTQLLLAAEGLVALKKLGVDPQTALDVINSSPGRSLMTERRIPDEVLTRNFNYGYKLSLMLKDVQIANSIMDEHFYNAVLFRDSLKYVRSAVDSAFPQIDGDSDYTEVVKLIEVIGGNVELKGADEEEGSLH